MLYECEECKAALPAGVLACPKCGEGFDEAVPQDAAVPKRGWQSKVEDASSTSRITEPTTPKPFPEIVAKTDEEPYPNFGLPENASTIATLEAQLRLAIESDNLTEIESLILKGVPLETSDDEGFSSLDMAAGHGDMRLCTLILDRGACVNGYNSEGFTPLMLAAYSGSEEVCRLLIERGANLNAIGSTATSALGNAVGHGKPNLVRLLLEAGAAPDSPCPPTRLLPTEEDHRHDRSRTCLMAAAAEDDREICTILLDAGAEVDARNYAGATSLLQVARKGHEVVCQLLISRGADVNSTDAEGTTPLVGAVMGNNLEACRCLIWNHADVNQIGPYGITALITAIVGGYSEICMLLLAEGARPEVGNLRGMNAFQLAKHQGHYEIATMLQTAMQTKITTPLAGDWGANDASHTSPPSSVASKLSIIFSVIYGLCCLGMLFSGGFYILFELVAIAIGFKIWYGGSQKKSFWNVWLIATFVPLIFVALGPIGIGLSLVARFVIIRLIR